MAASRQYQQRMKRVQMEAIPINDENASGGFNVERCRESGHSQNANDVCLAFCTGEP